MFDYTSKLYDSIPMCVIEALNAYPTLFDVEPWKKQANTYKIYNVRDPHGGKEYKANVIPPSQLPKWAYEQHTTATFLITCDRGISHELVRHRTASFSQQSTRYCKANKSGEIEIIKPSDGSRYHFDVQFIEDKRQTAARMLEVFYYYWRSYKEMTAARKE